MKKIFFIFILIFVCSFSFVYAGNHTHSEYASISDVPDDIVDLSDENDLIWGYLELKHDTDGRTLVEVAFTGDYEDLINKPSTTALTITYTDGTTEILNVYKS